MKNKTPQIIILVILLLLVITQTIIILDYYLDTFSFGIFSNNKEFISYYKSFEEGVSEDYLKPYRLIVKSGANTLWVIDENNATMYNNLWASYQKALKNIINMNATLKYEVVEWDNVFKNEGVTIEFKTSIPVEFLAYMIDENEYISYDDKIEKIHIKPESNTQGTVYIKTDRNLLVYENIPTTDNLTLENFSNLYSLLNSNSNYAKNRYSFYLEFIGNSRAGIEDLGVKLDIPVVLENNRTIDFSLFEMKEFSVITEYKRINSMDDMLIEAEKIKNLLLGSTADKHKTIIDTNGDIFFSNEYNIFSISKDSQFTYKFTPSEKASEPGDVKSAFLNSLEMLNSFFNLNRTGTSNLILYKVEKLETEYVFSFNYTYNGHIIYFDGETSTIVVTANETRVLEVNGKFYSVNELMLNGSRVVYSYNSDYSDLYDLYDINLLTIASDISIGFIRGQGESVFPTPAMIIEEKDGTIVSYELIKAGE
ncbi:MAG: hypothetical protein JXQ23_03840 [Clostridia bacterium]|nr:hypothetical protein [Clostridia bacterium]